MRNCLSGHFLSYIWWYPRPAGFYIRGVLLFFCILRHGEYNTVDSFTWFTCALLKRFRLPQQTSAFPRATSAFSPNHRIVSAVPIRTRYVLPYGRFEDGIPVESFENIPIRERQQRPWNQGVLYFVLRALRRAQYATTSIARTPFTGIQDAAQGGENVMQQRHGSTDTTESSGLDIIRYLSYIICRIVGSKRVLFQYNIR